MGYFKYWERALVAPMNFLLAIPGTAMFPLSMLWSMRRIGFGWLRAALAGLEAPA